MTSPHDSNREKEGCSEITENLKRLETPATTFNDIDIALITSENTEAEPQEKPEPSLQSRGVHSRGVTLEVGLDGAGKIKEAEERPLSIRTDSVCQLEIIAHVDRHAHTHTQINK